MAPAPRRATYEDLMAVPDHLVAEIVGGELVTTPRPASPHAFAGMALSGELYRSFSSPPGRGSTPGGWWILYEPELHFADGDVLVPDLAGWRRERMPKMPDVVGFTLAPDWVCEIVSPSTGRLDRARKMPIYARENVSHLWIVDPRNRTLEVFRLEGGRWVVASTHGDKDLARAEPFHAVELDLSRWWLETG